MNTAEFFDLVLPGEGLICLAIPLQGGGFRHQFFNTTEKAAEAVAKIDARGVTVYHACATFTTNESRLSRSKVFA